MIEGNASEGDSDHLSADDSGDEHGYSRRKLIGGAAIGAAVIWTSQFPFASQAIGQAIDGGSGPTGPTGPTGAAGGTGTNATTTTVPTGSTGAGEELAITGLDPSMLGALGAAAVTTGGALVWFRNRANGEDTGSSDEPDPDL